jgi:hypothetical protein
MTDLREKLDRELVRYLVGQQLGLCPVAGVSFDVRNAIVFRDKDGDPAAVISPQGWALLAAEDEADPINSRLAQLRRGGTEVPA